MNCVAFARCFCDKKLFSVLYFISFVCDGLDGWFARKFNQVSTFGAVLDMGQHCLSTCNPLSMLQPWLDFLVTAHFGYCQPLAANVQYFSVRKG